MPLFRKRPLPLIRRDIVADRHQFTASLMRARTSVLRKQHSLKVNDLQRMRISSTDRTVRPVQELFSDFQRLSLERNDSIRRLHFTRIRAAAELSAAQALDDIGISHERNFREREEVLGKLGNFLDSLEDTMVTAPGQFGEETLKRHNQLFKEELSASIGGKMAINFLDSFFGHYLRASNAIVWVEDNF